MMELFLFVVGAMLGIATFGFIVSLIQNDVVRWTTLSLGSAIGFFGFLSVILSFIA